LSKKEKRTSEENKTSDAQKAKVARKIEKIVRIGGADLDGSKKILPALTKIHGVSFSFSNAVITALNLDPNTRIGDLSEEQVNKIEDVIRNPGAYGIPSFLFNKRKDMDTGEDAHYIFSDLKLKKSFDIKRLQEVKSYRGMRHAQNRPVRGQRTKAGYTFPPARKSRRGSTVGVRKKKKQPGK